MPTKTQNKTDQKHIIEPEMPILELIERHPESLSVLLEYGFHCVGCEISEVETLESGAALHGFDLEDVLTDLDEVIAA